MHASPPYLPHIARRRPHTRRRERLSNSLAVLALLAGGIVWAPCDTLLTPASRARPTQGPQREARTVDRVSHPAV
jgi:hypothetical protein